jgi:hypothetical protein
VPAISASSGIFKRTDLIALSPSVTESRARIVERALSVLDSARSAVVSLGASPGVSARQAEGVTSVRVRRGRGSRGGV